jgi:Tfp pilus assembly protein FimT
MKKIQQQSGFSLVEVLLMVVVLAILGFTGFFVYQSRKDTDKTLDSTNEVAHSTTPSKTTAVNDFAQCEQAAGSKLLETYPEQCVTSSGKMFTDTATQGQKYLDIKQWGVKVAYTGSDTLSYTYNTTTPNIVQIVSANLAGQYGCTDFGAGQIVRYAASQGTNVDGSGQSASAAAKTSPTEWGHVGNYYYHFAHDEAACGNSASSGLGTAENAANTFTMGLVPKLTAD